MVHVSMRNQDIRDLEFLLLLELNQVLDELIVGRAFLSSFDEEPLRAISNDEAICAAESCLSRIARGNVRNFACELLPLNRLDRLDHN